MTHKIFLVKISYTDYNSAEVVYQRYTMR